MEGEEDEKRAKEAYLGLDSTIPLLDHVCIGDGGEDKDGLVMGAYSELSWLAELLLGGFERLMCWKFVNQENLY